MKRRILKTSLLLYLLFSNATILAQQSDTVFTNKSRHEIEIGYGLPPFLFILGSIGTNYNPSLVNIHSQYMYNFSKHFSLGANLTYSNCKESFDNCHFITLGVTGRAYWFYKKHWAMYSKYGLTLSIDDNDGSTFFWPLNFTFVGIEVGGKKWRGYLEPFSLSTWPIAQIGVKYLF